MQPSGEAKDPGEEGLQHSGSCDAECREHPDERAAHDIADVVLTGVDARQSDQPREDEGGDAHALRNEEQRHRDREGERCVVTWKRRVMRRRKQKIGRLDGEGTWSVPDTNEDLIDEQ